MSLPDLERITERNPRVAGLRARDDIAAVVAATPDLAPDLRALLERAATEEYGFSDKSWVNLHRCAVHVAKVRAGARSTCNLKRPRAQVQTPPLPKGQYDLIYADPCWSYTSGPVSGAAHYQYDTLSEAQLCALPIGDVCTKDAVLLMWVTWPKLNTALAVIKAWGFDYKTAFLVWMKNTKQGKPHLNLGWYCRSNTEFLLLATKGNICGFRDSNFLKFTSQILDVPVLETVGRGFHSRKPHEARLIIERAFPRATRLELFARGTPPPGWDFWGTEVNPDADLAAQLAKHDAATAVKPEVAEAITRWGEECWDAVS